LEVPETIGLLRGERDAIGLTAVCSVRALVGTRANPRTKVIVLRALRIALVEKGEKTKLPGRRSLEFDIISGYEESSGWT
jgi:hypothetical protein